jgi:ArsR family transcriptional regulator
MTECCSPVFGTSLDPDDADTLARRLKALADPARLRLLSLISRCGEVCGCEPVEPLGLSQPTVSHHLKVLVEAGLLERERRGKWIHYRVVPEAVEAIVDALRLPLSAAR